MCVCAARILIKCNYSQWKLHWKLTDVCSLNWILLFFTVLHPASAFTAIHIHLFATHPFVIEVCGAVLLFVPNAAQQPLQKLKAKRTCNKFIMLTDEGAKGRSTFLRINDIFCVRWKTAINSTFTWRSFLEKIKVQMRVFRILQLQRISLRLILSVEEGKKKHTHTIPIGLIYFSRLLRVSLLCLLLRTGHSLHMERYGNEYKIKKWNVTTAETFFYYAILQRVKCMLFISMVMDLSGAKKTEWGREEITQKSMRLETMYPMKNQAHQCDFTGKDVRARREKNHLREMPQWYKMDFAATKPHDVQNKVDVLIS